MNRQWLSLADVARTIAQSRGCDVAEARGTLIRELSEGARQSICTRLQRRGGGSAETIEIPAFWWAATTFEEWENKSADAAGDWWFFALGMDFSATINWDESAATDAHCLFEDIKVSEAVQTAPAAAPKNLGGRPTKFAWDDFWVEIVRIAELDNLPPTRAELQRHMIDFCAERFGDNAPEERTIRDKLKKIGHLFQG